jgi:hypothetical protein
MTGCAPAGRVVQAGCCMRCCMALLTGTKRAVPNLRNGLSPGALERKTGFEPATPYLASRCATAAPLPPEPRE